MDLELKTQGFEYVLEHKIINNDDNFWSQYNKIYKWCRIFEPVIIQKMVLSYSQENLFTLYEQIGNLVVNRDMNKLIQCSKNSKITCIYLDSPLKSLLSDKTFETGDNIYKVKYVRYNLHDVIGISVNDKYYDLEDFYTYLVFRLRGRITGKVSCIMQPKKKIKDTDKGYSITWHNLKEAINGDMTFPIKYMKQWTGRNKRISVISEELVEGLHIKRKVEVPEYKNKSEKIKNFF